MQEFLKKYYLKTIILIFIFYLFLFALSKIYLHLDSLNISENIIIGALILSTIVSIIFPIWFRIVKFNRLKNNIIMNSREFLKFEKILISVPQLAILLYLIFDIFTISKFSHLFLMVLGIYSALYYYPSRRRINLDKRIFRIEENN